MNIPTLEGTIGRRLLVNFRADPERVGALLPAPFRPQLVGDCAVVGVCLIRLERVRPAGMPAWVGMSSENAAHRFAVTWNDEQGRKQAGVYIPRRDTGSRWNAWGGGRLFPGEHHLARFSVTQSEGGSVDFSMRSEDGTGEIRLRGRPTTQWPSNSCFTQLEQASTFFRGGARGFSPRLRSPRLRSPRLRSQGLDGLELQTDEWQIEPFEADEVFSSFYADESKFPRGSVEYDHTLLMRQISHRWRSAKVPGAL